MEATVKPATVVPPGEPTCRSRTGWIHPVGERARRSTQGAHDHRCASTCPSRTPTSARTQLRRGQPGSSPSSMAMLEAERCLHVQEPDVHRGLPGARQHPALHRPAGARRHAAPRPIRCSTTTPCPASPAASARRRRSASGSACAARRASPWRSATSSASSPTGRNNHRDGATQSMPALDAARAVAIVGSGPGRPDRRRASSPSAATR